MNITARPNHQGRSRNSVIDIPSVQPSPGLHAGPGENGLFTEPCILQDLIDAGAFALNELAEGITRQEIAIPALPVEHGLPFLAVAQLAETLDPLFMIGFGHVDRTQNAAP